MRLASKRKSGDPMIVVDHVTKFYHGETVLDDVCLELGEGTNLGLIGPGGAGKSLLLKTIAGLVKPDRGSVYVDGHNVTRMKETELAELRFDIGMLFQNYALFDFMDVHGNVGFPLRQVGGYTEEQIAARVSELLSLVSLPNIGHQYPNELSGGMKKRVAFCRAVATRPPILFYDDPTMGLDPVTSSKIFIHLRRTQQAGGTTAVTVSHDIGGIADICDKFAMLDHGRLIFHGTPEEIERSDVRLVKQFWQGVSDD